MKREDFLTGMNGIDDRYILEAESPQTARRKAVRTTPAHGFGLAAAAVLAISIAIPNINSNAAEALQGLPVIGTYFKLVTLREYHYEDERHDANIKADGIVTGDMTANDPASLAAQETADEINVEITATTDKMIKTFKEEVARENSVKTTNVETQTITDNARWLSIKLSICESSADSYSHAVFYTVDKQSGKRITWDQLYPSDKDVRFSEISNYIAEQMRKEMKEDENKSYWIDSDMPEDDFKSISDRTQFYMDENDQLNIYFAQGEVGPMSMGEVTFLIPDKISGLN
ncbi:MAG: DUF3298 domain-containing protein [Lachnospiraceae bacterium]|nr:DUF3298 domain-containing protein [Lachnospiraceae bacterium]